MKFSEIFQPFMESNGPSSMKNSSYSGKKINTLSNIGAISFGRSITGMHEEMTPHFEMMRCEEMFERNPIVTSGINQLVTFVIPNTEVKIKSEDKRTKDFLEKWHKLRPGFLGEIRNLQKTKYIAGNAYLEKVRVKTKQGGEVLDNVFNLNDAARIYINPNSENGSDKYIFELPVGIQSFYYMGKMHSPTYTKIQYMTNYNWSFKAIYGIRIDGQDIDHYKSGWCLPFGAPVETENGIMSIGDIVKNKLNIKVKTYNEETNQFEFNKVVDWFTRPYKDDFYKIYYFKPSKKNHTKVLMCTKEHPVLTKNGYIRADELTLNDKVAVKTDTLNREQESAIVGTLLGDGNMTKRRHARLSLTHSVKQINYVDWFRDSLLNFNPNVCVRYRNCSISSYPNRIFEHHQLTTKETLALDNIYNMFYNTGKKYITKEVADKIDGLALAVWAMDDGTIRATKGDGFLFCTDNFSEEEISNLRNALKNNLNIETTLQSRNRIYIKANSMKKFEKIISPYLKLNKKDNIKEWVASPLSIINEDTVKYIKVKKIETVKVNTKWGSRTVYDLEVENNHNFVVNNIIVHNSRDGIYGKSPLASAIDADTVMDNILRSWNAITKNRMLSKKIISISDKVSSDVQIDQDRLDQLQDKLEDDERPFHLFNIPLQMLQSDVSTSSTYDTMEKVMDYLRKMIMVSLLPQHLTPWSDSGTTQGTSESMPSFVMRLKSEQHELISFLNNSVINELRKTYDWIADDATYVLDEPIVRASENYVFMAYSLVNGGILTPKQAQKYLINLGVIEESLITNNDDSTKTDNGLDDMINKKAMEWMTSGRMDR